jgi:hypothetical protein
MEEDLVGATVLDDLFIEKGFADVAVLQSKGPEAIFKSHQQKAFIQGIEDKRNLNLEELDDLLAQEDEDFAVLHAYRIKRLLQLEQEQEGSCSKSSIEEIDIEDFEDRVRIPSQSQIVVFAIYCSGDPKSALLLECIEKLCSKFRQILWVKSQFSPRIKGMPREDCPAMLVYREGQVIGQFSTLKVFAGMQTTPDIIEWEFAKKGILISEIEQDPRGAFKLSFGPAKKKVESDSDDDW